VSKDEYVAGTGLTLSPTAPASVTADQILALQDQIDAARRAIAREQIALVTVICLWLAYLLTKMVRMKGKPHHMKKAS
jgi:hypothetical protein